MMMQYNINYDVHVCNVITDTNTDRGKTRLLPARAHASRPSCSCCAVDWGWSWGEGRSGGGVGDRGWWGGSVTWGDIAIIRGEAVSSPADREA